MWRYSFMMSGYEHKSDSFEVTCDLVYPSDFNDTNKMGNITSVTANFRTSEEMYEEPVVPYFDPTVCSQGARDAHTRSLTSTQSDGKRCGFEEEPPLLEELGINPSRIFEKSLAVLNPFHSHGLFDVNLLYETDLAGPAALCILLGACLMLAGSKAHFGYVYGLVMINCIAMYVLLTLMTTESIVTFVSTISVIGYCLLPIVVLSVFGVFLPLYNPLGFICAALAVMWSSLSASKLFVKMSGDTQQRPLIAYACALLYGTFVLIIVF